MVDKTGFVVLDFNTRLGTFLLLFIHMVLNMLSWITTEILKSYASFLLTSVSC